MYALIKPKNGTIYRVQRSRNLSSMARKSLIIAFCDHHKGLQQISENLNHGIPYIQLSDVSSSKLEVRDCKNNSMEAAYSNIPIHVEPANTVQTGVSAIPQLPQNEKTDPFISDGEAQCAVRKLCSPFQKELLCPTFDRIADGRFTNAASTVPKSREHEKKERIIRTFHALDKKISIDIITSNGQSQQDPSFNTVSPVSNDNTGQEKGKQLREEICDRNSPLTFDNISKGIDNYTSNEKIILSTPPDQLSPALLNHVTDKLVSSEKPESKLQILPNEEVNSDKFVDKVGGSIPELSSSGYSKSAFMISTQNAVQASLSLLVNQDTDELVSERKTVQPTQEINDSKVPETNILQNVENNNLNERCYAISASFNQSSRPVTSTCNDTSVDSVNVEIGANVELTTSPINEPNPCMLDAAVQLNLSELTQQDGDLLEVSNDERNEQNDLSSIPLSSAATDLQKQEEARTLFRENYNVSKEDIKTIIIADNSTNSTVSGQLPPVTPKILGGNLDVNGEIGVEAVLSTSTNVHSGLTHEAQSVEQKLSTSSQDSTLNTILDEYACNDPSSVTEDEVTSEHERGEMTERSKPKMDNRNKNLLSRSQARGNLSSVIRPVGTDQSISGVSIVATTDVKEKVFLRQNKDLLLLPRQIPPMTRKPSSSNEDIPTEIDLNSNLLLNSHPGPSIQSLPALKERVEAEKLSQEIPNPAAKVLSTNTSIFEHDQTNENLENTSDDQIMPVVSMNCNSGLTLTDDVEIITPSALTMPQRDKIDTLTDERQQSAVQILTPKKSSLIYSTEREKIHHYGVLADIADTSKLSSVVYEFDVPLLDINANDYGNFTTILSTPMRKSPISTENVVFPNDNITDMMKTHQRSESNSLSTDEEDDWLPPEVEYNMTALLSEVLFNNSIEQMRDNSDDTIPNADSIRGDVLNIRHDTLSPLDLRNKSNRILYRDSLHNSSAEYLDSIQTEVFENIDREDEIDDDSAADEDYSPATDLDNSDSENDVNTSNVSTASQRKSVSANSTANVSGSLNISAKACSSGAKDNIDMKVETSDVKKSQKKYFCFFCKKMYSKITRHFEQVHKNETNVQKFVALPKRSDERRKIIDILRKKGNFEYNTSSKYNMGDLIPCRRPNRKFERNGSDYKACPNCLDNYSVRNIRHHVAKCLPGRIKALRSVLVLGKTVEGRLHSAASKKLRLEVFPPLREDDVVRIIRYDRILIIWGNKLCLRYTPHYQHNMIRARLRLMGRMLLTAKEINTDITDFASMYDPKLYDDVVKAARTVARFDEQAGEFGAPAIGMNLGTYLKQIGDILINEYIKSEESEKERKVEQFLKVFRVDFSVDVNKIALETQRKHLRQRKEVIPSTEDIKTFLDYLKEETKKSVNNLSERFVYDEWFKLSQLTMLSIIVFNRRRTGEIQNILVAEYENQECIDEKTDKDLYKSLSAECKAIANKYKRISIRGKKDRTVSILLYPQLLESIDLVIKNRGNAGVPKSNKFLFGLPSDNTKRTRVVNACEAMRKYSKPCGAVLPETLRGTKLRKHIATKCIALNLNDNEVSDLANFMGHAEKIHKDIYRQPIRSREIIGISKLLEAAIGGSDNNDDSTDEDDPPNKDDSGRIDEEKNSSSEVFSDPDDHQSTSMEQNGDNHHDGLGTRDIEKNVQNSSEERSPCQKAGTKRHSHDRGVIPSCKKARMSSECDATKKSAKNSEVSTSQIMTVKGRKPRWTAQEQKIVKTVFARHLKDLTLPSFTQIKEAKAKYETELQGRTVPQIKTWIDNQN